MAIHITGEQDAKLMLKVKREERQQREGRLGHRKVDIKRQKKLRASIKRTVGQGRYR